MTTEELVARLLEYARANDVESVVDATPYLEALRNAFRDREAREIGAGELRTFHRQMVASPDVAPLLSLLEKKSRRWEDAYALRARGVVELLQWESPRPVRALVELFDRPDFHPKRVLELGCGDGVNAVFMASRGCKVTAVDLSPTALAMARNTARAAKVGVDFVERDVFELEPPRKRYDFVFDRGMFHHVQVFAFDDYRQLVADQLAPGGRFHLMCHHVSTRPTLLVDGLFGSVGKLLSFLTGTLVETGAGFTAGELHEIFSESFRIESIDLVWDDNHRPLRFASAVMQRVDR